MQLITNKINKILIKKNLNIYQLNKLMDFSEGSLRKMIGKKSPFSKKAIEKILPILEVSRDEFESWVVADKYPKELLNLAIQARKNFPYKRKSILTTKIDFILQQKNMSRTALSKEIKYSQGGLNKMIIGKIGMSESVLKRVSKVLEIPQDKILSWVLADKYSLQVLELALRD
jgi:DNA-binding Xre family transcriptional regulator